MTIFSDRVLSQKLERAEATSNADFVETRARLMPETAVEWIDVAGAYAMFDGPDSPCTQTFGLGLFDEITNAEMEKLEAFFIDRGAPVFHEVSPMADTAIMPLLNERGYRPIEMSSILFRQLDAAELVASDRKNPDLTTRVISPGEVDLWARTSAAGWATEHESLADFMYTFGRVGAQCQGAYPFIAELDGAAISTGSLFLHEDVAILAGASTIPEGRNRGAQNALLHARLKLAAEKGCTLAVMGASPGSQSQKNAQKNGFQIAYTRTKWQLAG
jgi:hypothetical protein